MTDGEAQSSTALSTNNTIAKASNVFSTQLLTSQYSLPFQCGTDNIFIIESFLSILLVKITK